MSHYYECKKGKAELSKSKTAPQARKAGHYPSVTTVLGIIKNEHLDDRWKPEKIVELCREFIWDNPDMRYGDIKHLIYGTVQCPETGEEILSSEFGTRVHKRLEDYMNETKDPKMEIDAYDAYAAPFLAWLAKQGIQKEFAEHIVYDDEIRLAGSVDFIGKDPNGNYILADYKCRRCKGAKGKFYDKDCAQLAIEAWMFARMQNLDYLPSCFSICIDVDTEKHYQKEWDDIECYKGILRAKLAATIFWIDRMCEGVGQIEKRKKQILDDEIEMTVQILKDLKEIHHD